MSDTSLPDPSSVVPRAAIAIIESPIVKPHAGVAKEVFLFLGRITPVINVDLLIKNDGEHTLLTWRRDEFFGSSWHLPGGIIRYKETSADRIRACAQGELGAE